MKAILSNFVGRISLFLLLTGQPGWLVSQPIHPVKVARAVGFDVSPPLREMVTGKSTEEEDDWREKLKRERNSEHPVKFEKENQAVPSVRPTDPGLQRFFGSRESDSLLQSFNGTGNQSGIKPPDPDGDVSPDYYFSTVNSYFTIFSKTGEPLYGPVTNKTIWNGFQGPWSNTNSGDPIVLYDENAERWIFSQMALPHYPAPPQYELIAVSQTPDPMGAWNRYAFEFDWVPDYPKLGIGPGGYYLTLNQWDLLSFTYMGMGAIALERDSMLAGCPGARMIAFSHIPNDNAQWLLPADCDGPFPPAGTPEWFAYLGDEPDALHIFALNADWIDPGNSTFEEVDTLFVNPFTVWPWYPRIPQPGTEFRLNDLANRLMHRLQFRQFTEYASLVCNHTVEVDSAHFGIRWYELRKNDDNWTIFQQGTYAPDAACRWMGSIAMDENGSIALGYSVSSADIFPSVRYTGRLAVDPPGIMTISEKTIINGSGSQLCCSTGSSPWGDYSAMAIDPVQPGVFWYTQQYYPFSSNTWWQTRVGAFSLEGSTSVARPTPSFKPRIEVYPNPARESVTLKVHGLSSGEMLLTIADRLGQTIFTDLVEGTFPQVTHMISLKGVPDGIYFVIIKQGSTVVSSKIMKIN